MKKAMKQFFSVKKMFYLLTLFLHCCFTFICTKFSLFQGYIHRINYITWKIHMKLNIQKYIDKKNNFN